MGALVNLGQEVAAHPDVLPGVANGLLQLHPILPLDLVADVVLVAHAIGIPGIECLVGEAERQVADGAVQVGAVRVAAVLVAESAALHRVDRRVPSGVELAVGADYRVAVMVGLGAAVPAAGRPLTVCLAELRRGAVPTGRPVIVAGSGHTSQHDAQRRQPGQMQPPSNHARLVCIPTPNRCTPPHPPRVSQRSAGLMPPSRDQNRYSGGI